MAFPAGASSNPPIGLKWRSSPWTITAVIGLGVLVDMLVYSMIIPVIPFHLADLGFTQVASMTAWLLFAFSAGLVLSTIPIAWMTERFKSRRAFLIIGLLILMGAQAMLMEAPKFWLMCLARVLQGVGSSMVWVVGLALICDTAPPSTVGLQLGLAMCGFSVGLSMGPPLGGILYSRHGYRAPFILGICASFVDLIGRLLVIERKEAQRWGYDPMFSERLPSSGGVHEESQSDSEAPKDTSPQGVNHSINQSEPQTKSSTLGQLHPPSRTSLLSVFGLLAQSPRAVVTFFIVLTYGVIYSSQEPSIPVHLKRVWGLHPHEVGLVFMAAVLPNLVASPLFGYLADRQGTEWATVISLTLTLPWWGVLIMQKGLAVFMVAFTAQSFFTAAVVSSLTAELAAISRDLEGVGYGHVYGVLNLVYGVGSAIGPPIGGQMYDHLFPQGWMAICLLALGLFSVCWLLAFFALGSIPLARRVSRIFTKPPISVAS